MSVRFYEAIYIAHPNLEDAELHKLIGRTNKLIEKRMGTLLYQEVLGKKRLAYPVEKQRFGTYILHQFQSEGDGNASLNHDLELEENILAHMIVRIEEDEVREAPAAEPEAQPGSGKEEKAGEQPSEEVVSETRAAEDDQPEPVAEVAEPQASEDVTPTEGEEEPEPKREAEAKD